MVGSCISDTRPNFAWPPGPIRPSNTTTPAELAAARHPSCALNETGEPSSGSHMRTWSTGPAEPLCTEIRVVRPSVSASADMPDCAEASAGARAASAARASTDFIAPGAPAPVFIANPAFLRNA